MAKIVFNYNLCDHENTCPELKNCEAACDRAGVEPALQYEKGKVVLHKERCLCNMPCACVCNLFIPVDSEAEEWRQEELIRNTPTDANFQNIDRYNIGYASRCHEITFEQVSQIPKGSMILEISNSRACYGVFAAIEILPLLTKGIYDKYYRKLLLTTQEQIMQCEKHFSLNELPCLLFIKNGEIISKVSGAYNKQRFNSFAAKVRRSLDTFLSK